MTKATLRRKSYCTWPMLVVLGPVVRMVSTNHWLSSMETYVLLWWLTLVSANHWLSSMETYLSMVANAG